MLAQSLREWQAYVDCKRTIDDFLEQLPLFKQLANKAIRQRHWDEVMKITGMPSAHQTLLYQLKSLCPVKHACRA